ncbi:hypothetical protein NFI96_016308 [Prochilodus magdalenae]|nr:hypothetical protein NFI96_016308 [Prochilodus magdalenae]
MRFCYRIALALLLLYLFEDNALGAPTTGRFRWLRCKPNGNNANCVENQGPLIDLSDPNQRLRPNAKDIVPVENIEDTPETETEEQSGESSGDVDPFDPLGKNWMNDGSSKAEPQVGEQLEKEEGSGEVDYSNYVFAQKIEPKLPAEDLRKDNMIE